MAPAGGGHLSHDFVPAPSYPRSFQYKLIVPKGQLSGLSPAVAEQAEQLVPLLKDFVEPLQGPQVPVVRLRYQNIQEPPAASRSSHHQFYIQGAE